MIRRPPRSTRTDTLFPYTTLFRSEKLGDDSGALASAREADAPDIPADQQVQPADYVRIETARLENRPYPTIAPRPETARLAYLMLATIGRYGQMTRTLLNGALWIGAAEGAILPMATRMLVMFLVVPIPAIVLVIVFFTTLM